ncbi:c-type cytochrome [Noviherbaspirillum galbum]|uniref:Cytochrome c n=1 Tax=Noviherbaspirillum galbum TaxID=2709383 RepID=A0A6B3SX74_9BURK|nr:cytochrome c [Noviherbaspirillum galbum]NEX62339.1 cytochrome c [Noviherbaspirillum galbum]
MKRKTGIHLSLLLRLAGAGVAAAMLASASAADAGEHPSRTAAEGRDLDRGQILYENHCMTCHTQDMHWRERRLVTDMDSLRHQVRRWQDVARARWREEDIEAVARYLNAMYYNFDR